MKIKDIEYNAYLIGYIITLQDNRIVQVCYERCQDKLNGGHGLHFAKIDKINSYNLSLSEFEEQKIMEFINYNSDIQKTGRLLDKLWASSEDIEQFYLLLIENGLYN